MVRYEIYRDIAGEYRWRLVAANNQYIAWSEGYKTKQGAINSLNWAKSWANSATVRDLT